MNIKKQIDSLPGYQIGQESSNLQQSTQLIAKTGFKSIIEVRTI